VGSNPILTAKILNSNFRHTVNTQNSQLKAPLIVGISFVLGLLFDYFFNGKIPGIGFPIYVGLILVGLLIISTYSKRHISKQILWLLIPLIFFSSMVFVRSSVLLTFLNIVASISLLFLIAEISCIGVLKNLFVSDYVKITLVPFKFIRSFFQTLPIIFKFRGDSTKPKVSSHVVKGILMAIPVVVIFLVLFSSADLIFQKYLSNVIHINIDPDTIFRSILILCVTSALIGAYSYTLGKKESSITPSTTDTSPTVGHIETSILLGTVNVLFFAFVLLQLLYLFGGENTITSQGFTYAEYARKGFFELIAVAVISFLLLLTTEKYTAKKDTDHTLMFRLLSSALIVQVLLIMVSAFKRLSLYEEAYGFTTLRLYSHAFIILLAVIFILLLYKIHKDKRENAFAFRAFISIVAFLVVMNILNPDVLIAQRNIGRFEATGTLDTQYLGSLSDDALPETVKLLDSSNEDLKKSFAQELYSRTRNNSSFFSQWQSLNISRMNADTILKLRIADIETLK